MKTLTKPFHFNFAVIKNKMHVTDLVVIGTAFKTFDPEVDVKHCCYEFKIDEIQLDKNVSQVFNSLIDISDINNACFNCIEKVFSEEHQLAETPVIHANLAKVFRMPATAIAN